MLIKNIIKYTLGLPILLIMTAFAIIPIIFCSVLFIVGSLFGLVLNIKSEEGDVVPQSLQDVIRCWRVIKGWWKPHRSVSEEGGLDIPKLKYRE